MFLFNRFEKAAWGAALEAMKARCSHQEVEIKKTFETDFWNCANVL